MCVCVCVYIHTYILTYLYYIHYIMRVGAGCAG